MKDLYGKEISEERMEEYYKELSAFENMMYEREPKKESFGYVDKMFPDRESEKAYNDAYSEWHMKLHCDAPNKPGYYRANND